MVFFLPRENQNLAREKTQNIAREEKTYPWKNFEKLPVKQQSCPWNLEEIKIFPLKKQSCPETWKKSIFFPWKTSFCPWKTSFCPWKKHQKTNNLPVKKKSCPWKSSKNGKKLPVKNKNCPWKNWKKGQKWLSRATFFFTGKKKNPGKNTLFKSFKKEIQDKREEISNGLNSMQLSVLKPSGY